MSVHNGISSGTRSEYLARYLDNLGMLERLHRLVLDVIKDEFERLGIIDVNPVQGLLLLMWANMK